jgi:hypothetical protein
MVCAARDCVAEGWAMPGTEVVGAVPCATPGCCRAIAAAGAGGAVACGAVCGSGETAELAGAGVVAGVWET